MLTTSIAGFRVPPTRRSAPFTRGGEGFFAYDLRKGALTAMMIMGTSVTAVTPDGKVGLHHWNLRAGLSWRRPGFIGLSRVVISTWWMYWHRTAAGYNSLNTASAISAANTAKS
jgi:hypothetical protein